MLPRLLWGSLVALATTTAMPTFTAHAAPLPITRTLSVGRPRRPMRISLASGSLLTLTRAGTTDRRQILPARNARDLTLEEVPIGTDAAVAVVRVTAEDGHWVGLLGGRTGTELLSFHPADAAGDPGERRLREVHVVDGSVRTGVRFDGVSLCGGRTAWLEAQRIDPHTLTLQPSPMPPPRITLTEGKVTVGAAPDVPALSALVAVASSTLSADTQLPRAPRELLAADPPGFPAREGSFAQLRWEGGALAIEALTLEVTASRPQPLTLWWLSEAPSGLRTEFATPAGTTTVRIIPPAPITGRCLALYVADHGGSEPPQLRALRARTSLDRPGGIDTLIAQLTRDDVEAAQAASLLSRLGSEAATRLASQWDALSMRGKRRGLPVLAAALERDEVRHRVVETASADEADLRDAALATLMRGKQPGRVGLAELARRDSPAGDAAARALATQPEGAAALLTALGEQGAASRAALRDALSTCARHDPTRFAEASERWLAMQPAPAARAALALAAARGGAPALASTIAEQTAPELIGFEDRHRLALALHDAPPGPHATAWLEREAHEASEWMQRRAAFEALAQHAAPRLATLAAELAHDPYPRVRASALPALVAAGGAQVVAQLASEDPWPLVRAAALRALAASGAALEVTLHALDDGAPSVRQAALEALAAQRRSEAWPRVAELLAADPEPDVVRLAAIGFARELCLQEARGVLLSTARSLLSADGNDERAAVGIEALRALRALGGEAERAGAALVAELAAAPLSALWSRLPPAQCGASSAARSPVSRG